MKSIPLKKIIRTITDEGRCPLEYNYVYKGSMCRWDPVTRMIQGNCTDDNELAQACCAYLTEKGVPFDNVDELKRWALANWDNAETFCRLVENMERY